MGKRNYIRKTVTMKVIVAVVIVLFSISTGYTVKEQPDKKPNILFIMVDDLVPALGCYGNEVVQSPHIDKLASEGVQFSQAFCNVPVCGASRARPCARPGGR